MFAHKRFRNRNSHEKNISHCVSNESSPILVTPSCVTNDEINAKKTFATPSENSDRRKEGNGKKLRQLQIFLRFTQTRKERKAIVKLFALHVNAISVLKKFVI